MVGFNNVDQNAWPSLGYGMPSGNQLGFGMPSVPIYGYGAPAPQNTAAPMASGIAGFSSGYTPPASVAGPLPNVSGTGAGVPDTALGKSWDWLNKNSGSLESMSKLAGGIAQIWGGIQANKIAKQELALERESFQKNMTNSIKAYNTALSDRVQGRYAAGEQSQAQMDSYIQKNSL